VVLAVKGPLRRAYRRAPDSSEGINEEGQRHASPGHALAAILHLCRDETPGRQNANSLQQVEAAANKTQTPKLEIRPNVRTGFQPAGNHCMGIVAQASLNFFLRKSLFRLYLDICAAFLIHQRAQRNQNGLFL